MVEIKIDTSKQLSTKVSLNGQAFDILSELELGVYKTLQAIQINMPPLTIEEHIEVFTSALKELHRLHNEIGK